MAIRPQPSNGFAWVDLAAGPALVCRPLEAYAKHLFTTRTWALGSPTPDEESRRAAWRQLAEAMGVDLARVARLHQVHGCDVVVRTPDPERATRVDALPSADITVSLDRSLALAVQTADCVPILLADTKSGAVAAAHAGWRGLAARVPAIVVEALQQHAGARPRDLIAAVGPAIGAPRYEVGLDVRERFERSGFDDRRIASWFPGVTRPQHWSFDGWGSARDQLCDAGVPAAQIYVAAFCTATHRDLFCSYRRDGARAGRMAAAIRSI